MNLTDIAHIRLTSQKIEGSRNKTVKELVTWMGAMQAQDHGMAKWAIGIRLPDSTDRDIETAINNGEIFRTHLLRPTWHLVSADDIYWILSLTAPRIKAAMNSRHRQLGLTETIFSQSNTIVENALRGGKHLTREELLEELGQAKIALNENRASHLLSRAELDGIVCSGAIKSGKQTYALLAERVQKPQSLTREESLAKLAKAYFTSRCPATLQDFTWWSGLSTGVAKNALEMVRSDFISETIHSQIYWFPNSFSIPKVGEGHVHLLPAFDEFIISYSDRRVTVPDGKTTKLISNNGIFRPVIMVNGQAIGIWRRAINKDRVTVEADFFESPDTSARSLFEKAALQYGHFLEKKMEIRLP